MMNQNGKNFTYLNRGGQWLGHHWDGLEINSNGDLQLVALPLGNPADSQDLADMPAPDGPSGIAMDQIGSVYFSDPANNRVLKIEGCDMSHRALPCLSGELKQPRGLLWMKNRQALLIADSGHHRLIVFDPALSQVLEIWGSRGGDPGQFDAPSALAVDADGSYYVADSRRVQKFNALGEVVPQFWQNVASAKIVSKPIGVAAAEVDGSKRIYILDGNKAAVFAVNSAGNPAFNAKGAPISFGAGVLEQPLTIAAIGASVFAGDNGLHQLLEFRASDGYRFAGSAVGFRGPVAALAAGQPGDLLLCPGGAIEPIVLQLGKGFGNQGIFWTDAVPSPGGKVSWHRLEAVCRTLAPDAHIQMFFFTSDSLADAPLPPKLVTEGGNPFSDPKWCAKPADVPDVFLGGTATSYIWCGAWFSGDGLATPSVSQMLIEFDHQTYLESLPAIYRAGGCGDFLLRLLSLFETFNQDIEDSIGNLPALFDPKAAPREYLAWLAGSLAVNLEEDWDDATVRRAIATAFASYAKSGTPAGLKGALKQYAGVDAIIEEPLLNASLWALPVPSASPCGNAGPNASTVWQDTDNSILGFTTMLAPAQAQGAVVGTTAVLDQSHLMDGSDFGVPLFEDVAFQFSVLVYRGQVDCPAKLALVESIIEREKPAHTMSQLCILDPRMTVGFQARVGIDTIVGGPPTSIRLGDESGLGVGTALGGLPAARIGLASRLGISTVMG